MRSLHDLVFYFTSNGFGTNFFGIRFSVPLLVSLTYTTDVVGFFEASVLRGVGSVDTNNLVVVDDVGNDVVMCRNNVRSIDIALLEPWLLQYSKRLVGYELLLEPTEFTEKAST